MTDKAVLLAHPLNELLSRGVFSDLLHQVIDLLERESSPYRPLSAGNKPGGLVDLVGNQGRCPTMIIPDLHCRGEFFKKILCFTPQFNDYVFPEDRILENIPVIDLLETGRLNLVCMGDGLHSELHRERWRVALDDYQRGYVTGGALEAEMAEGLSLMTLVMKCKLLFPKNFHFLKGNHENIMNQWEGGDRPFRKFAKEGEMSRLFMEEYYGDDILYLYSHFESLLPLLVRAPRCLISHSEPSSYFSGLQVINAPDEGSGQVAYGLTWTKNGESEQGAVESMLQELLPQWWDLEEEKNEHNPFSALYFGGHRSIGEKYKLRQGGRFVQLHNPRNHQVALVPVHRPFDFGGDIIQIDR